MKPHRFLPLILLSGLAGAQTLVPLNDPKLPFTFSYPKGWLGVDLGDKTNGVSMVSAKQPPASMIRLLFAPKKSGDSFSLTDQFTGFEAGLKSTGVTVRPQSNYPVRYGGLSGLEKEYLVSKAGKSVKMRVWFAQSAKNLYSFQLTDSVDRYPAASQLFTQVMRSLNFR